MRVGETQLQYLTVIELRGERKTKRPYIYCNFIYKGEQDCLRLPMDLITFIRGGLSHEHFSNRRRKNEEKKKVFSFKYFTLWWVGFSVTKAILSLSSSSSPNVLSHPFPIPLKKGRKHNKILTS